MASSTHIHTLKPSYCPFLLDTLTNALKLKIHDVVKFLREIHVSMEPKKAERLLYWGKWSPKTIIRVTFYGKHFFSP